LFRTDKALFWPYPTAYGQGTGAWIPERFGPTETDPLQETQPVISHIRLEAVNIMATTDIKDKCWYFEILPNWPDLPDDDAEWEEPNHIWDPAICGDPSRAFKIMLDDDFFLEDAPNAAGGDGQRELKMVAAYHPLLKVEKPGNPVGDMFTVHLRKGAEDAAYYYRVNAFGTVYWRHPDDALEGRSVAIQDYEMSRFLAPDLYPPRYQTIVTKEDICR
jgi:hypothetical protein